MITDNQTNFLYLADSLPKKYPAFFTVFKQVLDHSKVPWLLLPGTKDVWAVDYMPVQIEKNRFVQFVYNPDYLRNTIKWRKTITDVNQICESIHVIAEKSPILIDGGNVIRSANKVIMCDKVFRENPQLSERRLIKDLEEIFQVDKIIFIPTDPDDFTGHADGLGRFFENDTVLINAAESKKNTFQLSLRLALHNAGLKYIEIPYNPSGNRNKSQANGIYLNYLQMEQAIIIPVFGIAEDDPVEKQFVELFNGKKIYTVNSNEIAKEGGILNCISWNILQ